MSYTVKVGSFLSADKETEISYRCYLPEGKPRAVVQIAHDFKESISRYESEGFVERLTAGGIVVCGNDAVGHGDTAKSEEARLHLPSYKPLVEDLNTLNGVMKKRYPRLPYLLFGHGVGSLAARIYLTKYENVDGVILSGTGDGRFLGMTETIAAFLRSFRGENYRSKRLDSRVTEKCCVGLPGKKEPSYHAADPEAAARLDALLKDMPAPTAVTYRSLFALLARATDSDWPEKVPLSLPILIVSGERDPFAEGGESIRALQEQLTERELNDLQVKLYPGARHDLFFDVAKEEAYLDLLAFVDSVVEGVVAFRSFSGTLFGRTVTE